MGWTSPRTWVTGETPTATIFNTHVRDNLKALGDAWTAYTPTWTAVGTAPVLGNGTISGWYLESGKTIDFRIVLTAGSTTTFGTGAWRFTFPFTAIYSNRAFAANGLFTDVSGPASWPVVGARCITTGTFEALCPNALGDTRAGLVTTATPYTWATGDVLEVIGRYERA